jgi:hypothetical protein
MMDVMDLQNEPLTKKIFLDAIGIFESHIDAKLDARFGAFELRMDEKMDIRFSKFEARMDNKLDERFGLFESHIDAKFDAKLNVLEERMDTKLGALEVRMDEKIDALALSTQQEFAMIQQEFVAVRKEMAEGFASIRTEIGAKIWESESRILRAIGDIAAVLKNHDSRLVMLERIVQP